MRLITEVTVDVDLVRSYDNFLIGRALAVVPTQGGPTAKPATPLIVLSNGEE